jgi:type III pantothenate kinase
MNLVIDIGNSRTKFSLFNPSGMMLTVADNNFGPQSIEMLRNEYPGLNKVILSATGIYPAELKIALEEGFEIFIELNENTPIPLKNGYKTPATLGNDRLAAAVGANLIYPGTNILIIDAGTAITFDLVSEAGEYLGGNISPGLEMRFKALHNFTGKLPLISSNDSYPFWGDTTHNAILAGVQNGILFEIDAYIGHFKKFYKKNEVIFTGGDVNFFESKLKNSFFVHSNLVATGLNRILEYNAENL